MIKRSFFLMLLMLAALTVAAQQYMVVGRVADAKTQNAVEYATAALLNSADSTLVVGVNTGDKGEFMLRPKKAGNYILKVSFMGMSTKYQNVQLNENQPMVRVGMIPLSDDSQVLSEAIIKGTLARVEQKEDTTIFNAGAYRVPEGSTLEALVKQLPGVEIDDNGKITWNGKEVKELMVNGKDFFKGQKNVAMKNLPVDIVSRIRAYDKQSDYAEMTGIDDGEERTVLDIMTKRQFNESFVSNVDLGYGTEERYTGKVFVSHFTDFSRVSAYGSMNNVNDAGFGSYKGWGGKNGLIAHKDAGIDFTWENGKEKKEGGRLELGGSVNYSYTGTDKVTTTASETFLSGGSNSSFSNSFDKSSSSSQSVAAQLSLDWTPDSMTSIKFRPSYNHSSSKNGGQSLTATFNADPYSLENMFSPLDSIFSDNPSDELEAIAVNRNQRQTLGDSKNNSIGGELNIVRRLGTKGRNISFKASGNYGESENNSFSISNIAYYNGNAPKYLNQYSTTPAKNWNYNLRAGYVEPIAKDLFAEVRYTYGYKYTDNNRSRYNLEQILDDPNFVWNDPENAPFIGTLPTIDELLNSVRDLYNSQYATYKYMDHAANLGIKYQNKTIRFNVGVDLNPERTKMEYERPGQHIDTLITRDVFNVSPQLRFRYRFSKTDGLDIKYKGSSSQPSMTDLLSVVDNSNPLNISMGNPGLKPSWNNSLRVFYRGYNPMLQQGIGGGIMFNQTKNSVSNLMVYDEATGVRYTRPENINGNWDTRAMFMYNMGLGKEKNFTITTFSNVSYSNSVGYVSSFNSDDQILPVFVLSTPQFGDYTNIFDNANVEKGITRSWAFRENLRLNYRNDWFDVGLQGKVNYNHARSELQENNNMDTWNFSYGANANFNFDWGMSLSTDIGMSSRRGFSDASMNTNELLWNAQLTQSFLKNKAATVSLQFYDILQKQSNVSRTINSMMRSDSWNNAINSYCMVHFIYKLNIFGGNGGKKAADEDKKSKYYQHGSGNGSERGRGGYPGRGGYGGGGGYHGYH